MKSSGIFRSSLRLFSTRDKVKFLMITLFQLLISALDLLGVVVIGLIGLSVIPTSESNTGPFIQNFYKILHLTSSSEEQRIVTLCLLAVFPLFFTLLILERSIRLSSIPREFQESTKNL